MPSWTLCLRYDVGAWTHFILLIFCECPLQKKMVQIYRQLLKYKKSWQWLAKHYATPRYVKRKKKTGFFMHWLKTAWRQTPYSFWPMCWSCPIIVQKLSASNVDSHCFKDRRHSRWFLHCLHDRATFDQAMMSGNDNIMWHYVKSHHVNVTNFDTLGHYHDDNFLHHSFLAQRNTNAVTTPVKFHIWWGF